MISTPSVSPSATGASASGQRSDALERVKTPSAASAMQEADNAVSNTFGEAVIVSVSDDSLANQAPKAPVDQLDGQYRSEGLGEWNGFIKPVLYSQEDLDSKKAKFEREVDIISFKSTVKINTSIVNFEKERIDFLENVEPAAPRVLTGDEAKETLRMLQAFKEGDVLMGVSETGRRSWTVDGMSYALYPDGTLTAGEAGVPTSEEERQLWLETSRERYNRSYEGLMRAQESLAELGYDGNEVVA